MRNLGTLRNCFLLSACNRWALFCRCSFLCKCADSLDQGGCAVEKAVVQKAAKYVSNELKENSNRRKLLNIPLPVGASLPVNRSYEGPNQGSKELNPSFPNCHGLKQNLPQFPQSALTIIYQRKITDINTRLT